MVSLLTLFLPAISRNFFVPKETSIKMNVRMKIKEIHFKSMNVLLNLSKFHILNSNVTTVRLAQM